MEAADFMQQARRALAETDPGEKVRRVNALLTQDAGCLAGLDGFDPLPLEAGRPQRPELLPPAQVPHRGLGKPAGRVALIHAIAHIEFNAINLGLDALCRFSGLPADYYRDWLGVAGDEARHFCMLRDRLADHGAAYGDLPAHNGLWEMAVKTAEDPLERMALVPRVLEARGLDVTPGMIVRLKSVGDGQTVEILETILEEEIPHVAVGSRWFRHLCAQRNLPPLDTFADLFDRYMSGRIKGPFNEAARLQAGFDAAEMAYLNRQG